jgi:hypothetical protein
VKKALAVLLFVLSVSIMPARSQEAAKTGPFGFYFGETREQVLAEVGPKAVKDSKANSLGVTTAPKPYPGIEEYVLFFSPKSGLLKIVALGEDIDTNDSGDQLQSAFKRIETGLVSVYGQPSSKFDFLKSGSIWSESNDWMMGLVKQDRSLDDYWIVKEGAILPNHIHVLCINAVGLSRGKGFLKICYEFDGWEAYTDEVRAQQDKAL